MRAFTLFAVPSLVLVLASSAGARQTAPPAPVLSAPANGASVVQPIRLDWNAVVDPDGPIVSYSWQVSTTSSFAAVIASGFHNPSGPGIPLPTDAQLSGLANGTYFWRVRATQEVGGATGFLDSPFSAARSLTITGLGPAPGIPTLTSPAGTSFHTFEFYDLVWNDVPGAVYYILEADEDSGFAHPINLSGGPTMVFGTKYHAGWGNEIPNIHYRVRAVSADNVWGRPSSTVTVHITNTAPVPPAPTPLAPVGGASITIPFRFDWTDTTNPQTPGYDVDIDDEPGFQGAVGVMMIANVSRSDCLIVGDPLVEGINHLPPGTYFWRVRATHGSAFGPWSAGQSFTVTASPAIPSGLRLFWILTDPGAVHGGNSTAARIALNMPAPPGGAQIFLGSDFPGVEIPVSVLVPAGATDVVVAPVTSPPVSGAVVSDLRAAYGPLDWQQNSIGMFPILWGGALGAEQVFGGSSVTGTVTLLGPAPTGGVVVTLVSSDTTLAQVPASVLVPAGATGASFTVTTSPVSVSARVVIAMGSAFEQFRAPGTALVVLAPGSPTPPPALSSITLSPATVLGGGSGTGTVTLTAPAPAGGASIRLSGSMEGDVVVPANVTIPAGSLSASFPITPPPVARPNWVIIQASYGFDGQTQAKTLRVDPGPPGPSPLFAFGVSQNNLVGGTTVLGTVGLTVPAPPGGEVVTLLSQNTSVAQVPASVTVAAGSSTASFNITTSVQATGATGILTASAGGVSKDVFLNIGPDPNAPLALVSISPGVSAVVGGNPINTFVQLNKEPPAGGGVVALSSSNPAAAQVPASVTVQPGLTFANFNITTSAVAANTPVTITGTLNGSKTAVITVLAPPNALSSIALAPSSVVGGSPSTGTATLTSAAPSGGTVVSLSSSNSAVASVPASVTVGAGATSATFAVTTSPVASTTSVTISGSAGGANRSATLSVTPNSAGFHGPTANAADVGGDGNGFEVGAVSAHTDDAASAVDNNGGTASSTTCTSTSRDSHRFSAFGLGVAAGSSVLGIEVRLDARVDGTGGAPKMCVQLSGDGGATWTGSFSTPTLTTTMTSYVLGGSADTWGRAWTSSELSDANFRVRVTNVASSTARDFSLEWIAVRATTGTGSPDTTPPSASVTAPSGGATVSGTTTITASAADNVGVTRVEFLVDGALLATDTSAPYSTSWNTTGATNGAHALAARAFDAAGNSTTSAAVNVTVSNGSAPVLDITLSGVPTSIARGQTFTATATVTNTGGSAASGYTVLASFTPSDSLRLENPQNSSQSLATVAAGGAGSVAWQIKADRSGSTTLTMTLRNSSGVTVDTVSRTLTITN